MTSPVEFPMYGKFKKTELSKENLLAFWDMVLNRADFNCVTREKVEHIAKAENGVFTVKSANNQYRARAVILALSGCGKTRFEADAVPRNSLVSTAQPDKKKVCVDKTSSSWMCSATLARSSEYPKSTPCARFVS